MTEHERVIQQRVIQHFSECCDIAEANGNGWVFVRTDVLYEAIDLLKAQEPVEPKREVNQHGQVLSCGICGAWFTVQHQKYCHECGRAVKWDG